MSELTFVNHLDLSDNHLSGKIPSSTQLQSLNASCFARNPGLCGPPLSQKCWSGEQTPNQSEASEEYGDEFWKWFYATTGFGFVVGCIAVLKRISLTWMVNFTLLEVVLYLLNLDLYIFLFRWRSDQELHAASAAQANRSARSQNDDPIWNWKSVPKCVSSNVSLSEPASVSKTVGLVASNISESSLPELPSSSSQSFNTSSTGIKNGLSNFKNFLRISDPQERSGNLATSGIPNIFHFDVNL
ncbi:receptor-like protein eix2 [Quercus suber]|uniref:Receptor-like protein eix2 n=1 Tax=Quercus suber TaxID=58331 RepID=A0AAW0K3Y9_QUESU